MIFESIKNKAHAEDIKRNEQYGEGYKKLSMHFNITHSIVISIIHKWKEIGALSKLARLHHPQV